MSVQRYVCNYHIKLQIEQTIEDTEGKSSLKIFKKELKLKGILEVIIINNKIYFYLLSNNC